MVQAVGVVVGSVHVGKGLKVVKYEEEVGSVFEGGKCVLCGVGCAFCKGKGTFFLCRENVPFGG
ncbi:hypothetical protein BWD121_012680 [Bartonella sp. WD12.1]|nr:hypothetical protein BWD121_012680 [Bartonella sp. WD12.1]